MKDKHNSDKNDKWCVAT